MAYRPDPGGNFASDAHRRVLTAVPNPAQKGEESRVGRDAAGRRVYGPIGSEEAILYRVGRDEVADLGEEEVLDILSDLEADGDVSHSKDGWFMTKQGVEVAEGPIAWPPATPPDEDDEPKGREHD